MSSNLDPEEVQAIMDLAAPEEGPRRAPPEVSARDFSKPRRLSPGELETVQTHASLSLPATIEQFANSLRNQHEIEILDISEVNADDIFGEVDEPFAIAKFDIGGQPGWLVWELIPALAVAEILLGASEPSDSEPRAFTSLERRSIERLLSPFVTTLASSLELAATNLEVLGAREDIGTWTDGGKLSEPSRLHLSFTFDGPGGASHFDLYLPGIHPHQEQAGALAPATPLPNHIRDVTVNLVARLGDNQIPLADLLAIEVGDVIPLETPVTEPLRIYVEDVPQPCGRGFLGSKRGNLAIRIEQIGLEDEDSLGTIQ